MVSTTFEQIDPKALVPWPKNPRKHPEHQIAALCDAISEVGFLDPVVVDEENTILAGHARVQAAKALGIESVPVVRAVGLTSAQKRAHVIADNRLAGDASWDTKLLGDELRELEQDATLDLRITGFTDEELDRLIRPKVKDSSATIEDKGERNATGRLSYNLVFDTIEQQDRWFSLLKWLKRTRTEGTAAARIYGFLGTVDMGGDQ